ncbi:MAG: acyl carrier protein [Magnetospiraceae bacterium]
MTAAPAPGLSDTEQQIAALVSRVLRRKFAAWPIVAAEVEEWDSMKHIEVIMELEMEFDLEIDPEAIADLHSNTQVIAAFIDAQKGTTP